jgi:diacylglycerol kinase (ATP)
MTWFDKLTITLTKNEKEMILKNNSLKRFSLHARLQSFRFAFEGLTQFFREEHNAIIHLFFTILVFAAAIYFHLSRVELAAVIFATGFVWSAELFNTAVEKLADKVSSNFDPKIKFIKDVSAAAVLVAACSASLIGTIVFLPKILL